MSIWNEDKLGTALVGKTIETIAVNEDESALEFVTACGKRVYWVTQGDCCSESWWADGFSLNALRGGTVRQVNEIEMPEPKDDRTRQEVDEAHGFELVTDKGKAQLVFRNSSNGYYGGWASEVDAASGEFRVIVGNDWQA